MFALLYNPFMDEAAVKAAGAEGVVCCNGDSKAASMEMQSAGTTAWAGKIRWSIN